MIGFNKFHRKLKDSCVVLGIEAGDLLNSSLVSRFCVCAACPKKQAKADHKPDSLHCEHSLLLRHQHLFPVFHGVVDEAFPLVVDHEKLPVGLCLHQHG